MHACMFDFLCDMRPRTEAYFFNSVFNIFIAKNTMKYYD